MPPAKFKLKKANGQTKIITFDECPPWDTLAHRVSDIYEIPLDQVGIAAIDGEGDTITYSGQVDLEDFYNSLYDASGINKFVVQNLNNPDSEYVFVSSQIFHLPTFH